MVEEQENEIIDATKILMDIDNEKILLGTYSQARSAIEINQIYGIPVATCFKKMKALERTGLLKVDEIRYTGQRPEPIYRANLQNAYVFYDSGKLKVRFEVVLQMASGIRKRLETSEISMRENINVGIHV